MAKNESPWLSQLNPGRPTRRLEEDGRADVAIVGAGIAGVSTAFFILKNTDRSVAMLEADKMAHGATGHNAGQVVSYFERGFASLVKEFGKEKARDGQLAVEGAWELLDQMYSEAKLDIPLFRFTGHAGCMTLEHVLFHLRNNAALASVGLKPERMRIAENAPFIESLPEEYAGLYEVVSHGEVLELLETQVPEYFGVLSHQRGVMNSALFCQEVAAYLAERYGERFALYEHSPVEKVVLHGDRVILDVGTSTLSADQVVLATNGFESFDIFDEGSLKLDHKFHQLVSGTVGYMAAYFEDPGKEPHAICYFDRAEQVAAKNNALYYYMTRRPFQDGGRHANLISIGGPDVNLEDTQAYSPDADFPDEALGKISQFVRRTHGSNPGDVPGYAFTWHGLMGYTRNWVRLVGPEPQNPRLLYNLGCNGIGILPSVYGGSRVADFIAGKKLPPSIFDAPAH